MKKILSITTIFLGVFAFAAFASASTADVLQPASDVVYDENLIVNGTGIFDSVRIGKQGVGGVTFFNGTIVNETTNEADEGNPVTFGDDVRIDGAIHRGETAGPGDGMQIKLNDDVEVMGQLTVNGVSGLTDADIPNNLTASNYLPLSGGTLTGDLDQDEDYYGIVKAGALVTTNGSGCDIRRSFGPYTVTCIRNSAGSYRVKFDGLNVYDRFFQITPYTSGTFTNAAGNVDSGPNPDEEVIRVFLKNHDDDYFDGQYFMINIY